MNSPCVKRALKRIRQRKAVREWFKRLQKTMGYRMIVYSTTLSLRHTFIKFKPLLEGMSVNECFIDDITDKEVQCFKQD